MAEPASNASSTGPASQPASIPEPPKPNAKPNPLPNGNPALRMLGLPYIRAKLPGRNWLIFFTLVGSWTGALIYDRRQKKKVQAKWCTLVEHIAKEPLPADAMPRRVTIVLAAPPGDGLRAAREHFTEYVKPVLVAGALDWDVVEGRREGAVRAGIADRTRRARRRQGELAETEVERTKDEAVRAVRERGGVSEWDGVSGDVVIGRHTWKEYVRGLHEGWLGPLDPPPPPKIEVVEEEKPLLADAAPSTPDTPLATTTDSPTTITPTDDASPTSTPPPQEKEKEPPKPPEKPPFAPPHNTTTSYPSSTLPPSTPTELSPATTIPFPHILGFLNTPIRMYRFLNRRSLADDVGRQTAAAVLASYRPFHEDESHKSHEGGSSQFADDTSHDHDNDHDSSTHEQSQQEKESARWEQTRVLAHEESSWLKSVKQRKADDPNERVWLDPMVIDERIGRRMRRFEVAPGDEERAKAIWKGARGIPGRREGDDGGLGLEGGYESEEKEGGG